MPTRLATRITSQNACWIFVSGSSEDRHLFDVVLGVDCLKRKGVSEDQIFLFLEHPQKSIHLPLFGITKNVFGANDLEPKLSAIGSFDHAVVIVGGHGSVGGVTFHIHNPKTAPGTPPQELTLPPKRIFSAIRSIQGLKSGVVVLCQCYAGLFNFVNAGTQTPELIVLGATNLNLSLSGSISLTQPIKRTNGEALVTWLANIFQLYFSLWLANPNDIDGDGTLSLLDAYKFAGVHANEYLRQTKRVLHFEIEAIKATQMRDLSNHGNNLPDLLAIHSAQVRLNMAVEQLYLNQEPWILNAHGARDCTIW